MHKLLIEDNQTIPAVLYQENTVEGFTDHSNNAESWHKYGSQIMDYLFYRDKINTILFPTCNPNYPTVDFSGWGNLSSIEKKLMALYILAPYALRLTQYSDADDESNWFNLLRITQGTEFKDNIYTGRAKLVEKMRKHVANKVRKEQLTMITTQSFYKDIYLLKEYYIGSAAPDFKFWLTNEAGTDYENNGFAQKSYYSQTLKDELMLIYNEG